MTSLGFNTNNGSLNVLSWKGSTLQEVVTTIQKNTNTSTQLKSLFSSPLPLKIYRRNIGPTTNNNFSYNNQSQSLKISYIQEQPGSTILTNVPICDNNGINITVDLNLPNSNYEKGVCNSSCISLPINALNRVRSAGMIRTKNYNVNSYEYLQNRDRTISQNQFNYIQTGNNNVKPGSALALLDNNTYVQNGSGQFNVPNKIVIYKPNNSKYAQQGGVSSSSHIERIKLETIENIAYQYKQTYGTTSNDYKVSSTYSGSYGPSNSVTYGKKNLYNVPTPQITNIF